MANLTRRGAAAAALVALFLLAAVVCVGLGPRAPVALPRRLAEASASSLPQSSLHQGAVGTTEEPLRNYSAAILQALSPMTLMELREEAWLFGLPSAGEKAKLTARIQGHILARVEGTSNDTGMDAAASSGLHAAAAEEERFNGTDGHGRKLQGQMVYCVCKNPQRRFELYCKSQFFTLMLCYPNCAAACERNQMAYEACDDDHMIIWLERLAYQYHPCLGQKVPNVP
mmetsp:Transcript_106692/g.147678  ORF Transcript_106692/g.147678 Transcript_106692/m.147678 type:complete len:228 (+) Transcript_106692:66-749(+)